MHFVVVFTDRTKRTVARSLETQTVQFNRETVLTKTVRNYPKTHGQTKGGTVAPSHPPLENATGTIHEFTGWLPIISGGQPDSPTQADTPKRYEYVYTPNNTRKYQ